MPSRPRGGPGVRPLEERRRVNPGHHGPLPPPGSLIPLEAADGVPEPARALEGEAYATWCRIWTSGATWLAVKVDAELILMICEQIAERERLRKAVLDCDPDWRSRSALRTLEKAIYDELGSLGFNPSDRTRMAVAEVTKSPLDDLMDRRRAKVSGQ